MIGLHKSLFLCSIRWRLSGAVIIHFHICENGKLWQFCVKSRVQFEAWALRVLGVEVVLGWWQEMEWIQADPTHETSVGHKRRRYSTWHIRRGYSTATWTTLTLHTVYQNCICCSISLILSTVSRHQYSLVVLIVWGRTAKFQLHAGIIKSTALSPGFGVALVWTSVGHYAEIWLLWSDRNWQPSKPVCVKLVSWTKCIFVWSS